MRVLRTVVVCLLLACLAVQLDVAHDHHCVVEKVACATCRAIVTPMVAPADAPVLLPIPALVAAGITAVADAHRQSTALRDAFRLRAPPLAA